MGICSQGAGGEVNGWKITKRRDIKGRGILAELTQQESC